MRHILAILLFCLSLTCCLYAQDENVNGTIAGYFQEVKIITSQHKDLWGIDLYGPILIVNPFSHQIYANYPDTGGVLKQEGEIYTGILPKEAVIANTAEWKEMGHDSASFNIQES